MTVFVHTYTRTVRALPPSADTRACQLALQTADLLFSLDAGDLDSIVIAATAGAGQTLQSLIRHRAQDAAQEQLWKARLLDLDDNE